MKLFHNEIDLQVNFKSKPPLRCLIKAQEKIYQYLIKTNNGDDDIIAINKGRVCKLNETFEQLRDFHNDSSLIVLEIYSLQSLYDQTIQLRIEKKEIETELRDVEYGYRKLQERFRVEVIQLEEHIRSSQEKTEKFGQSTVNSDYFPSQFQEAQNQSQIISESKAEFKNFIHEKQAELQQKLQCMQNMSSLQDSNKFFSDNCLQCFGKIGLNKIELECQHNLHLDCFRNSCEEQLQQNRPNIQCHCGQIISVRFLRQVLTQDNFEKLMTIQLEGLQESAKTLQLKQHQFNCCNFFYFQSCEQKSEPICPFCN